MKKLLIATALATFALTSQAEGLYVQGDLGLSRMVASPDNNHTIADTIFDQRLSLGYDLGNQFRLALDYTNFGQAKLDEYRVKVKSIGVTGFYDFDVSNKDLVPYVGARIAYNKANITESDFYCNGYSQNCHTDTLDSYSKSRIGIGALGGIQYKISSNLSINTGIEFNLMASDLSQGGIKLGLRYNF